MSALYFRIYTNAIYELETKLHARGKRKENPYLPKSEESSPRSSILITVDIDDDDDDERTSVLFMLFLVAATTVIILRLKIW